MLQETRDASRSIPQAMIWGYISNGLMGVLLVVTVCFSLPDLDAALNDPSGYPFLYAFQAAVGTNGTIVLTLCLLIVVFASNIAYLTSTGRETFAFARDNGTSTSARDSSPAEDVSGLPFGRWLGAVHPRRQIPTNALIATSAVAILLSLLNIGSSAAFNAIISLNTVALMVTYALSIGCVLWRRVAKPETLPPARWSLGRYGVACNAWGVVYSTWACFWAMWPPGYPVTLDTFNWAPVIFAGVTVVCVGMYWATGRRVYEGPAVLVAGKRANRVERATRIAGEE
jgi:choline transport protein